MVRESRRGDLDGRLERFQQVAFPRSWLLCVGVAFSGEAWRLYFLGDEMDNFLRKSCVVLFHITLWVGGVTVLSNIADEANRMLRCGNGEVLMESWERGLDGRLQRKGTYCYSHQLRDRIERWTTNEDGEPVQVNVGD